MPSLKNWGNGPTRRSKRLSEPSKKSRERKRKRREAVDELEPEVKVLLKRSSDGRKIDSCCWICHKAGQQQICASCPRVYHNRCLKSTSNALNSQGVCPECLAESVDKTELPAGITKEFLQDCLIFLMLEVFPISPKVFNIDSRTAENEKSSNKKTLIPVLSQWPQHVHEVCFPMDVEILIDFINSARYSSTAAFYGDVKWMYHNCYKVFGVDSNITTTANKLVKQIKNELLEMESCFECYYKNNSVEFDDDNPFVTLCKTPHRLLWVKLRGYSSWPSKCLKVINNIVHVQFFGTHERTSVKTNLCFLMSKENPSGKKIQRAAYQKSIDEMNLYIKNYEEKYGPYKYAPTKTVFVPLGEECCVVKKKQETSSNQNASVSSELANESSNPEETDPNSSQDIEIIDDVEIAESSENNALYESCELIDVTDEDEAEVAVNNSESESLVVQDESSDDCEETVQEESTSTDDVEKLKEAGVETSMTSNHDGITVYEEQDFQNFSSGRYVLHMPSQTLLEQNASAIFEPSIIGISNQPAHVNLIPSSEYPSVESVHSSTSPEEEIHPDLPSDSQNELSNGSHSSEINQHEEEEVCYVDERQRKSMLEYTRTDLSTLSNPVVKSLVSEGEDYVQDVTKQFLQHTSHFAHAPKLVQKLVIAVINLDAELQAKRDEIKELEMKLNNGPDLSKYMSSLSKRVKQKLKERIAAEKQNALREKSRLFKTMRLNHEKCLDLWNGISSTKKFVDQGTSTSADNELEAYKAEYFKLKREKQLCLWELKRRQAILHAKTNTWCKKCLNQASLHCCINANYCEENCQIADAAEHAPVCQKPENY